MAGAENWGEKERNKPSYRKKSHRYNLQFYMKEFHAFPKISSLIDDN